MKNKFVFRYDRHTKKGIIKTDKGEFEINLKKKHKESFAVFASGSGVEGYGLHLI